MILKIKTLRFVGSFTILSIFGNQKSQNYEDRNLHTTIKIYAGFYLYQMGIRLVVNLIHLFIGYFSGAKGRMADN